MLKKLATLCCTVVTTFALATSAFAAVDGDGFHVSFAKDSYGGVEIFTGSDASVWPFSESGDSKTITFEKDTAYRLTFEATSTGTSGFRVRWAKDKSAAYTAADTAIVNDHVKKADEVATVIPAYFQDSIANGETKTYTVEFTTDGSAEADGLIGNIYIRGQSGSNDFNINSLKLEKIGGEAVIDWKAEVAAPALVVEAAPAPAVAPAAPAVEAAPATTENPKTGDSSMITLSVAALVLASGGILLSARKLRSEN